MIGSLDDQILKLTVEEIESPYQRDINCRIGVVHNLRYTAVIG